MFKLDELLKVAQGELVYGSQDILVKGISIDSRTIQQGEAFIAIKGDNFDGHNFITEVIRKGASAVIFQHSAISCRPSAKVPLIEVKDTQEALGDIARYHRNKFDIPIIAVTGSNGKTTTKEMISWVLSTKYNVLKNEGTKNNHIGLPMTLLGLNYRHDIAVLEIGTNHFGEVDYLSGICQPNIGIITNVGPAHLEFFKDIKGVFKEKSALIKNLRKPHMTIVNADDKLLRQKLCTKIKREIIFGFSIEKKSDFQAGDIAYRKRYLSFCVNQKYKFLLKTPGYHNIYNALAAMAVARVFGMDYKRISSRLSNFIFPQSRFNLLTLNNVQFIDDTYNSNPLSLKQALHTLANFKNRGRKILVMGDMLELGEQEELFHAQAGLYAAEVCDVLITVGRLSKLAAQSAQDSGLDLKKIFHCESSREAREILLNSVSLSADDIVLVKGSRAMRMEEVFK